MKYLVLSLALVSANVSAAPIIQVVATGSGVSTATQWAVFTLSDTWTNVSISLELNNAFATPPATPSAKVFLTNNIGPSTLPGVIPIGNEFAPTAVLSAPVNGFNVAFSGLTLGPDSYFLTFENTEGSVGWVGFSQPPASTTLAPGVIYGGSQGLNPATFAPAGTSNSLFRANNFIVTGDLVVPEVDDVPEPSTLALTLGAVGLLWLRRRSNSTGRNIVAVLSRRA